VLRLNDKDAETLKKALDYSRKAYEEALAAKESSLRVEHMINDFVNRSDRNENSNGELKKKKHFWYTVSITFKLTFEKFI
jgi:hypothetical protein